MSDTQSITYNTGLNAVAVDSIGNLVTDSAGNLVIPIEPVIITVESESNHSDCKCAIVNVIGDGSQTFMPCVGNMPFRQNSINWLGKATDIHAVQLVSNLRNVNMESLSFDIIAGIQVHRPVGEFSPSYMQVKIQWGDKEITSDQYYVCHQSRKVFNIGNININLQNNTLSYTGVDLPTNASSVKCEQKEDPPEPEVIVIDAPYAWCYADNITGDMIYTETDNPLGRDWGDIVNGQVRYWHKSRNEIAVWPDEDKEAAIILAADCCVLSAGTADYIVFESLSSELAGLRLWRDRDKDSDEKYTPIPVLRCETEDQSSVLYVEFHYGASPHTGRVWKDAADEDNIPDSDKIKYLADNYVASDLQWQNLAPYTVGAIIELDGQGSYKGTVNPWWISRIVCGGVEYCQLGGVFNCPENSGECPTTGWEVHSSVLQTFGQPDYTILSNLMGAVTLTTGAAECGENNNIICDAPHGYNFSGAIWVEPLDNPSSTEPYFVYDGNRYTNAGITGYVFDSYRDYAWSPSPCQSSADSVVFTHSDSPDIEDDVFNESGSIGSVITAENGVRSLVVESKFTGSIYGPYYWAGSSKTNIDEEFE